MKDTELVTILFRHPDPNVRKLPGKPLEYKDPKGETEVFMPETIETTRGPQTVYKVPLALARRMLANQGERYFLMEPTQIVVKKPKPGGMSFDYVKLDNSLAAKFLGARDPDQVAAEAKAREEARRKAEEEKKAAADRKVQEEAEAKRKADQEAKDREEEERQEAEKLAAKAKADQDALRALESIDLPADAIPSGNPPEIL